jgi:hypothetical protein
MKHVFSVFSVACVVAFTLFLSTTSSGCKKEKGDKGDTGVANMRYSAWFDVPTFQPVKNNAGDTVYFTQSVDAPLITDSVLNKGDIKVFVNVGTAAAPNVISLPLGTSLIPIFSKGKITFQGDDDYSTFTSNGSKTWQYRYVVLNGTIAGRRANMSYQEVQQLLGIKD